MYIRNVIKPTADRSCKSFCKRTCNCCDYRATTCHHLYRIYETYSACVCECVSRNILCIHFYSHYYFGKEKKIVGYSGARAKINHIILILTLREGTKFIYNCGFGSRLWICDLKIYILIYMYKQYKSSAIWPCWIRWIFFCVCWIKIRLFWPPGGSTPSISWINRHHAAKYDDGKFARARYKF